jgi:hypothetical protein
MRVASLAGSQPPHWHPPAAVGFGRAVRPPADSPPQWNVGPPPGDTRWAKAMGSVTLTYDDEGKTAGGPDHGGAPPHLT